MRRGNVSDKGGHASRMASAIALGMLLVGVPKIAAAAEVLAGTF